MDKGSKAQQLSFFGLFKLPHVSKPNGFWSSIESVVYYPSMKLAKEA